MTEPKLRFRMKPDKGVHFLRKGGQRVPVKPGEIITCTKDEIHGALDKFEQLDLDPKPSFPQPTIGLRIVERRNNWYDVINEKTGERLNDKALRKEEAEELARTVKVDEDETDLKEEKTSPDEEEEQGK